MKSQVIRFIHVSILIICLCSAVFGVSTVAQSASQKQAVIIDTDAGWDDYLGIIYALTNPRFHVVGIVISCTGEVDCIQPLGKYGRRYAAGAQHILQLLDLTKPSQDVPVAIGVTKKQSVFVNPFPAFLRAAADNFNGIAMPSSDRRIATLNATQLMHRLIERYPGLIILELAPLTNLADLQAKYPEDFKHIAKIFMSGGSLGAGEGCEIGDMQTCRPNGNVNIPVKHHGGYSSPSKWAEWNVFADITSAASILNRKRNNAYQPKIIMIPLELLNQFPDGAKMRFIDLVHYFQTTQQNAVADFVVVDLEQLVPKDKKKIAMATDTLKLWDGTASVAALDKNSYRTIKYYPIQVQTNPNNLVTLGWTKIVPSLRVKQQSTAVVTHLTNFYKLFWQQGINRKANTITVQIENHTQKEAIYLAVNDPKNQNILEFG
ncbi:MAG: nucleoside hydrolase, partial [Pseudomonadota bacterium]